MAERLSVHATTVLFPLETLVSNGQADHLTADRGSPGRPARLYRPVQGMDPTGPRHYRDLAEALADGLADTPDPRRRMVQAGRSWGRRQAAATTAGPAQPGARLGGVLGELE